MTHTICRIIPAFGFAVLLSALSAGCDGARRLPMVRPPALAPGDTIAFVAPAGRLEQARMDRARERLEQMGFRVIQAEDLFRTRGYLAGQDARRAQELMAVFTDPQVKAIFPGTGNYGTTRMLDRLDYALIRKNPKIFIGFSDITGLHLALQKRAGLVTFHSPNPMWGLGSEGDLTEFSSWWFWRALRQEAYTGPGGTISTGGYTFELPKQTPPLTALAPGVARGQLTGGNLSLIVALMGTPYEIDTRKRILFLEDVGERPYRIDRYLSQLKLAGKLDDVAGVLLGHFRDCDPKPDEDSLTLAEVFEDYFADLGVPVIANFPAGHARDNATLPFGVPVELDADQLQIRVLENPVVID